VLICLCFAEISPSKLFDKIASKAILFLLLLVSMCRFDVGLDYLSYVEIIQGVLDGSVQDYEFVFKSVVYISNYFFNDFKATVILTFTIFALLYLHFIDRFIEYFTPNNRLFSTAIFTLTPIFYLASLNAIRNCAAIAVVAFSLKYVVERRKLKFLATILFAYLIHKTAILLLPIIFLLNHKITKMRAIFILLVCVLIAVLGSDYLTVLTKIKLADQYFEASDSKEQIGLMGYLLIGIAFSLMRFDLLRFSKSGNVLSNMIFCGAALVLMQPFSNVGQRNLYYRFSGYFTICLIVVIPIAINNLKHRNGALLRWFVFVVCSAYYWFNLVNSGLYYNLVPYRYVFFEII
jgi:hypothetical protein